MRIATTDTRPAGAGGSWHDRAQRLDMSNRVFTGLVMGGGGVIGSAITFLLAGGILWAILYVATGRLRLRVPRGAVAVALAFAAYFAAEALSVLVNDRTGRGVTAIVENIPFIGFALVVSRLAFSSREAIARATEIGVAIGAVGACAFAAYEIYWVGIGRATGLAGNAGPFALVCAVLYGLAILAATRQRNWRRLVHVGAAVAAAAAIAMSGMRSLWPVIVVAPLIPVVAGFGQWTPRRVLRYAMVTVVLLAAVFAATHSLFEKRLAALTTDIERVVEEGNRANSLGERLNMWAAGLDLAAERPIFGYSPKKLPGVLAAQTSDESNPLRYSHFHNFVLTAQLRAGIFGVAATFAVLLVPIVVGWRARRRDSAAAFGYGLVLVLVLSYVSSGLLNIMLGHDILDTLYIYGMIVASYLLFGDPALAAGGREEGARQAAELSALAIDDAEGKTR